MKEILIEKLNNYKALKTQIENEQFDIEAKVQEYRNALLKELERNRFKKIEKLNTYIELLECLIAETKDESIAEPVQEEPVQEEINLDEVKVEEQVVEQVEEDALPEEENNEEVG